MEQQQQQQTPVEWYANRLHEIEIAYNEFVINSDTYINYKNQALEEAKEKEKQLKLEI